MEADKIVLDNFEEMLRSGLIKLCHSADVIGDELLESIDLEEKWNSDFIKDYIADAVENYNQYPEAALAWAGFLGMAAAYYWDADWNAHKDDTYKSFYGERGFDDLDEHILKDILSLELDDPEAVHLSSALNSCAVATLALLRHEDIEAGTSTGFYALARAYSVFFSVGVGMELHRLGYKKVPVFNSESDIERVKGNPVVS